MYKAWVATTKYICASFSIASGPPFFHLNSHKFLLPYTLRLPSSTLRQQQYIQQLQLQNFEKKVHSLPINYK